MSYQRLIATRTVCSYLSGHSSRETHSSPSSSTRTVPSEQKQPVKEGGRERGGRKGGRGKEREREGRSEGEREREGGKEGEGKREREREGGRDYIKGDWGERVRSKDNGVCGKPLLYINTMNFKENQL